MLAVSLLSYLFEDSKWDSVVHALCQRPVIRDIQPSGPWRVGHEPTPIIKEDNLVLMIIRAGKLYYDRQRIVRPSWFENAGDEIVKAFNIWDEVSGAFKKGCGNTSPCVLGNLNENF